MKRGIWFALRRSGVGYYVLAMPKVALMAAVALVVATSAIVGLVVVACSDGVVLCKRSTRGAERDEIVGRVAPKYVFARIEAKCARDSGREHE